MTIPKNHELTRIFFLILVSFVSLTTIPSIVYGSNWVFAGSNEDYTDYYNPSSIKIDKQNNIIKVWAKLIYTPKGKNDLLNRRKELNLSNEKYMYLNYSLILYYFNYKEWKFSSNHVTVYSKSGGILGDGEFPYKWKDIPPDSVAEEMLNKILNEYNIHKETKNN